MHISGKPDEVVGNGSRIGIQHCATAMIEEPGIGFGSRLEGNCAALLVVLIAGLDFNRRLQA